jgi:predicted glutamine amidotransferase
MCIAILNKTGILSKDAFKNSWENNYDGAGFAYSDGNKIIVHKEDKGYEPFYKMYAKHRKKFPQQTFLVHFRISTHGTVTKDNLHPFVINDNVALIHNGMVNLLDHKTGDKRSDTNFLCEEILSHLPDGWHLSTGVHKMIAEFGGGSKFVMLDVDNNHSFVNEKAGHWFEDNWYSNKSYVTVERYVDYGGTRKYKGYTDYSLPSYGASKPANYNVGVESIPYDVTTKLEKHLQSIGAIDIKRYVFSGNVDTKVAQDYAVVEETTDSSSILPDTWYHIDGHQNNKKYYAMLWTTYLGQRYSFIAENGKDGFSGVVALPVVVTNDTLLCAVIEQWESAKPHSTSADKLDIAIDNCFNLVADAYDMVESINA